MPLKSRIAFKVTEINIGIKSKALFPKLIVEMIMLANSKIIMIKWVKSSMAWRIPLGLFRMTIEDQWVETKNWLKLVDYKIITILNFKMLWMINELDFNKGDISRPD